MSKKTSSKTVVHRDGHATDTTPVDGLYESWFLDYASYVILERAIPRIEDGLKPVQRRIMHACREMDDGRFNKVANVIGQTMQYHPHGDAAIGDAIVNLGQKGLLLDTQGNWGDIRTGDRAAAPRYIEARLSPFALEVVYNPQTTVWQRSYDGRKKEPVTLPVKFPLLLLQGVEGIAVGLSTKILPHNFCELIRASISILKGKTPTLYPDFPTGGHVDCTDYNHGKRGGRIRVRAKIDIGDKNTLHIVEIPYGTTTHSLIESIVKANEKGKIKVKRVVDNTAQEVELQVCLQPGQPPQVAVDALYAFTDCEVSLSPNACVIADNKPGFMDVRALLRHSVEQTTALLKKELQIREDELQEKIFFSSLEKLFIEKRMYRNIETCETFEEVLNTIEKGLAPYKKQFYRPIVHPDIVRLTEIKIKRISKYDSFKADEALKSRKRELAQTRHDLKHLAQYAIAYYESLLQKYGKGRERKTAIKSFRAVAATEVIANNQKLYVNRADGFVGWGLKKDEYLGACSDIDDVIAVRREGKAMVSRIAEKIFMGTSILYAGLWKKGDERMVYNLIYVDGKTGVSFVKRVALPAVVRDREYDLTQGTPRSKLHYFSANPNGEAEVVQVKLSAMSKARKKTFEFDFSTLEVKGRGVRGNILTRYPVRKVVLHRAGASTLGGLALWFDPVTGRLNKEKRGPYVGRLDGRDTLLSITRQGRYQLSELDLNARFEPEEKTLLVEKFDPENTITAVYRQGRSKCYFVKRFRIETQTLNREFEFIPSASGSVVEYVDTAGHTEVMLIPPKGSKRSPSRVNLAEKVDVKGWKAIGNLLSSDRIHRVERADDKKDVAAHPKPKAAPDKPTSKKASRKKKAAKKKADGKNFRAGDVIELDL